MSAIDMVHLRSQPYFAQALHILDQFGLHHLMQLQCDYSPDLIMQFYATIVFLKDDDQTMMWMSGTEKCEASLDYFGRLLGYDIGKGRRMHEARKHSKNEMSPLYEANGRI